MYKYGVLCARLHLDVSSGVFIFMCESQKKRGLIFSQFLKRIGGIFASINKNESVDLIGQAPE